MATIREIAREYFDEMRLGIAHLALWKEGRSWHADLIVAAEMDDNGVPTFYTDDVDELREIVGKDPDAVLLNADFDNLGGGEEQMTIGSLAHFLPLRYEDRKGNLAEYLSIGRVEEWEDPDRENARFQEDCGKAYSKGTCSLDTYLSLTSRETTVYEAYHNGLISADTAATLRRHSGETEGPAAYSVIALDVSMQLPRYVVAEGLDAAVQTAIAADARFMRVPLPPEVTVDGDAATIVYYDHSCGSDGLYPCWRTRVRYCPDVDVTDPYFSPLVLRGDERAACVVSADG